MYWKEIIYMSLFENEIKKECVGYLKTEKRQDEYQLEIQVKKIPMAITGNFPIRIQSETGWQESGMLAIKDGGGKWSGSAGEPVLKAEIMISGSERIKGESKKAQTAERQMEPEEPLKVVSVEEEENKLTDEILLDEVQENTEPPVQLEAPPKPKMPEKETAYELKAESMAMPAKKISVNVPMAKVPSERRPLYENKWEQLLATYEQIHPYGDDRIYVKLEPKDFIILRESYQHLVNNSFLLHGFYNYRYLILGKEGGFYLGVPGVFYEREKMVALMFGFEAFECKGGEAEEGKFGYYLRKVEL